MLAISLDTSGDIFIDAAGKAVIDHANVQRARLQTDNIKWLVGKWAPRVYGDKVELLTAANDGQSSGELTITWASVDRVVPEPPQRAEPRQLQYHKRELPDDASDELVSRYMGLLDVIERIVPADSDPSYVFGLIEDFLRKHFLADTSSAKTD